RRAGAPAARWSSGGHLRRPGQRGGSGGAAGRIGPDRREPRRGGRHRRRGAPVRRGPRLPRGGAGVRVLAGAVTAAGRALAGQLPFEATHGRLADTVRSRWTDVDGFVLCCATGVAVRVVAPLLSDKHSDPAVVCVDDGGRFVIALCGGHERSANALARDV